MTYDPQTPDIQLDGRRIPSLPAVRNEAGDHMPNPRMPFGRPDTGDDFVIGQIKMPEPPPLLMPSVRLSKRRLLWLVSERDRLRAEADDCSEAWHALKAITKDVDTCSDARRTLIDHADALWADAESRWQLTSRQVNIAERLWGPIATYEQIPGLDDGEGAIR